MFPQDLCIIYMVKVQDASFPVVVAIAVNPAFSFLPFFLNHTPPPFFLAFNNNSQLIENPWGYIVPKQEQVIQKRGHRKSRK